jgi:hypothetical protein
MSSEHCNRNCIIVAFAVAFGILFGLSEASLWISGYIPTVRFIVPYAAADAMLIFALTPILALLASKMSNDPKYAENDRHHSNFCLSGYVKTIMIAAATFLIFVQIFVGTLLPRTIKILLSFVGATSFWIMFVAFIMMVFYLFRRK